MRNDMTRENILRGIRMCAKKLGRAPSYPELLRAIGVTRREIRRHFATYTEAVRACGFRCEGNGHQVPLDALFKDWAGVARKIKKLPTVAEYELHGKYSVQPLFRRFGSWRQTPLGLLLYAQAHGLASKWRDVLDMVKNGTVKGPGKQGRGKKPLQERSSKILTDRPTYGAPMVEGPLANEPDNEQAVVFLFGAMARELGFVALKIRTGYPDCEAMREVAPGIWQKVNIEIEQESRNFVKHLHNVKKCDLIVCWKHNWPQCPLEVIELRGGQKGQRRAG
jgi:Homing endonuclease associated repeat